MLPQTLKVLSHFADETLKNQIIQKVIDEEMDVRTDPVVSPTGFPFKVVQLEGTLSDAEILQKRTPLCDVGLLRQLYKEEDGKIIFRCPAEPIDQFVVKGGLLEDTVGRQCLCNNLSATAGFPQHRKDGYIEAPMVTAGDGLVAIGKFFKPGQRSYTAQDVLDYLTQ